MTNSENSSTTQSHGKLIAVVVAAAVVIILAVLSAFVWPGWAIQKNDGTSTTTQNSQQKTESSEPTKPTIDATALPDDASELLKAMPDSVLNYARTKADASTTWNSASPLEEYTLTYSTGDAAKDVTLVAAQWSSADNAKTQYDALVAAQTGDESASGNVKVAERYRGLPSYRHQGSGRSLLPEVPDVVSSIGCQLLHKLMNVGASTLLMWMPQLRSGHMRTIGNILIPSVWQHVYYSASCNFYD